MSVNPAKRFTAHKCYKENPHLTNAFKKYKDVTHTILIKGTKEYCLEIEKKLRPTDHIGWNIVPGGGLPPVKKAGGKQAPLTEEQKQKLREANLRNGNRPPIQYGNKHRAGKIPWNKGKTFGPSWNAGLKTGPLSPEHRQKISAAMTEFRAGV